MQRPSAPGACEGIGTRVKVVVLVTTAVHSADGGQGGRSPDQTVVDRVKFVYVPLILTEEHPNSVTEGSGLTQDKDGCITTRKDRLLEATFLRFECPRPFVPEGHGSNDSA